MSDLNDIRNAALNRRRFLQGTTGAALLAALNACGGSSSTPSSAGASSAAGTSAAGTSAAGATSAGAASVAATSAASAADELKYGSASNPITISFWSWGTTDPNLVPAYKKAHPYITLKPTSFGSTSDLYPKLATVYKSGTGAPDTTAVELPMMPTYAAGGYFADLAKYGASVAQYDASAAHAAQFQGNLYAIPTDYGPMVMYYRTDVFEKYNLTVPTTWDEYEATGKALKAADPKAFMSNLDPGDSTELLGMIWQGGGRPFALSGKADLTINLADAGTTKVAQYWEGLLKQGYVNPVPSWSTDWFAQMGNGTYATWFAGAWGSSVLAGSLAQNAGKWKAAAIPNWTSGAPVNAAMGGSGTAVSASSPHKEAAAAFAEWYGTEWPMANVGKAGGATFPASITVQKDPAYLNAPAAILGGQLAAQLYVKLSSEVATGWQFLPYQLYANNIYKDTAGQQVAKGFDIPAGLAAWQKQLVSYGNQQGFKVNG